MFGILLPECISPRQNDEDVKNGSIESSNEAKSNKRGFTLRTMSAAVNGSCCREKVLSRKKSELNTSNLSSARLGGAAGFGAAAMGDPVSVAILPWGTVKMVSEAGVNFDALPANFSAQTLILELFSVFERKLNFVANDEPLDKPVTKSLKRGEDAYLDNLLRALNGICDVCLPSVLDVLIKWYSQQQKVSLSESGETRDRSVKRTLGASYLFCVTLIEILPQIHYHPTDCEEHVNFIVNTSFSQISFRDPALFGSNYNNSLSIADAFSEVIGVLSQSHSRLIQRTFTDRLNELRRDTSPNSSRYIISLVMGMRFFRIKISQISEFEMGVSFLDELGTYFLETDLKQKDLKHALAGLLVEILVPVAAQIKTEANIPSLIAFVDKLYGPTYDLVNKKQHKMAAYPLLTCLLCISQSKFFISNWVQFLNLTLANLKNKDNKISRIALESLYRLLWVYIIRNSCEGNTATRSRLESICGSLFPRGNRNVIPRDAPLNIFIKIIQFIAQQTLDFAFREIIFDLLGCNRASRSSVSIYPERMNIGIRALMVIADGLQQKEGPPAMPLSTAPIASGTMQRAKKVYITRPLTAEMARQIGLEQYYQPCRKAFDAMLRALDTQVGRPLMLTSSQLRGKEYDDVIVGDIKPKLDLLRACIAAIPRLLPDPASMSHQTLIDMLIRMSIHVDEELRATTYQALQNLLTECPEWRDEIIHSYLRFLNNGIQDTYPTLLESTLRFLLQLLCTWKTTLLAEEKRQDSSVSFAARHAIGCPPGENGVNPLTIPTDESLSSFTGNAAIGSGGLAQSVKNTTSPKDRRTNCTTTHYVEGFAFMMLCQLRSQIRKIAISILKEARQILQIVGGNLRHGLYDTPLITVLDEATPYVITKYIEHVSVYERQSWNATDFATACDKIANLEPDNCLVNSDKGNEYMRWDPWACALSGYCEYRFLLAQCPTAVTYVWPALFNRLNACNQFVDPSNPQNESRGSLLRSSKSKSTASTLCKESLGQDSYLSLWQKYLVVCCALAQPSVIHTPVHHAAQFPSAAYGGMTAAAQYQQQQQCITTAGSQHHQHQLSSASQTSVGQNTSTFNSTATSAPLQSLSSIASSYQPTASSIASSATGASASSQMTANRSFSPSTSAEMDMARSTTGVMSTSFMRGLGGAGYTTSMPTSLVTSSTFSSTFTNSMLASGTSGAIGLNSSASASSASSSVNCSQLFQKVANMLRWENMTDMRDSVVLAVGSTNPVCFEILLEELSNRGLFRDVQDKKAETNVRRRKRKDLLRMQLIRVIEVALFRGVLQFSGGVVDYHSGRVAPLLLEFLESIRQNVETDADRDISILTSLRLHFTKTICLLINGVSLEKRRNLFTADFNHSLFLLFFSWCGRIMANDRRKDKDVGAYVEQNAIQAMCALCCCGSVFESPKKTLNDEEYLYRWLEALLASNSQAVQNVCEETLCLVLHLNEHYPQLFEWTVHICYTKSELVASRGFRALAMLFSKREYPCEFISLFVLCQTFAESADLYQRQTALLLLQMLRRQFLDNALSRCVSTQIIVALGVQPSQQKVSPNAPNVDQSVHQHKLSPGDLSMTTPVKRSSVVNSLVANNSPADSLIDKDIESNNSRLNSLSQKSVLSQFSKSYIQLTMSVFSEVCNRIETAVPSRKAAMLNLLFHWVENVELVDSHAVMEVRESSTISHDDPSITLTSERQRIVGSGCEEATQLLLNNLLYLTSRLSAEHNAEVEALWSRVAISLPGNLPIIVHYLFVMISLAPDSMIPVAKKICTYLLNTSTHHCGERLVKILMEQLVSLKGGGDAFRSQLIRCEMPPYYRWVPPSSAVSCSQSPQLLATSVSTTTVKQPNLQKADKKELIGQSAVTPEVVDLLNNNYERKQAGLAASGGSGDSSAKVATKQLPMPPYGGHYSNLSSLLPPSTQVVSSFLRSNLSLFLLSDLIGADDADGNVAVNWRAYVPTILHMAILGLDAHRPIICAHSRRAIINTCLVYLRQKNASNTLCQMAMVLLNNQLKSGQGEMLEKFGSATAGGHDTSFGSISAVGGHAIGKDVTSSLYYGVTSTEEYLKMLLANDAVFGTSGELLLALVHCLSLRRDQPFWANEEVTTRCWRTTSAVALGCFVRHIAEYFIEPEPQLPKLWTNVALDIALSTTDLHLAGRSFQVVGALCQPPNAVFIVRILSRLVDVVGASGSFVAILSDERTGAFSSLDDAAQSYVTHLMMCLMQIVGFLNPDVYLKLLAENNADSEEHVKDGGLLSPEHQYYPHKQRPLSTSGCVSGVGNDPISGDPASIGHCRSISYTPALLHQAAANAPTSSATKKTTETTMMRTNQQQEAGPSATFFSPPISRSTVQHQANRKEARHSLLIERNSSAISGENAAVVDGDVQNAPTTTSPIPFVGSLNRSKSATTILKMDTSIEFDADGGTDAGAEAADRKNSISCADEDVLCMILYISTAMLESNVDNEFLLALQLTEKIFKTAATEATLTRCFDKLQRTAAQLEWNFAGIVGLVSRGTMFASGVEPVVNILICCVNNLSHPAIIGERRTDDKEASSQATRDTFALVVTTILPHCLVNFDAPSAVCVNAARTIAEYCNEQSRCAKTGGTESDRNGAAPADDPFCNLATMMNQYHEQTFSRDRLQWAKCVVNYLLDAFKPDVVQLIVFLAELLERSSNCVASFIINGVTMTQMQCYLLNIINLLIAYGNLVDASPVPLNAQVIRIILRHVQGPNSREASKILKSFVDQWKSIAASRSLDINTEQRTPHFELFAERLDPIALCRSRSLGIGGGVVSSNAGGSFDTLKRTSTSGNMKVREKLLSLLSGAGLSVTFGDAFLTKGSTVQPGNGEKPNDMGGIEFDASTLPGGTMKFTNASGVGTGRTFGSSAYSSSDDRLSIYPQTDVDVGGSANTGNEMNVAGGAPSMIADRSSITTDSFPRVFKEFDFLEAERDSVSESTDSCFNWLSTMRSPRNLVGSDGNKAGDGADDRDDDFLGVDDVVNDYYNDDDIDDAVDEIIVGGGHGAATPKKSSASNATITSTTTSGTTVSVANGNESIERLRQRLRNSSTTTLVAGGGSVCGSGSVSSTSKRLFGGSNNGGGTPGSNTRRHRNSRYHSQRSSGGSGSGMSVAGGLDSIKQRRLVTSRTSDESNNDVSSDRTPIQSPLHHQHNSEDDDRREADEEGDFLVDEDIPEEEVGEVHENKRMTTRHIEDDDLEEEDELEDLEEESEEDEVEQEVERIMERKRKEGGSPKKKQSLSSLSSSSSSISDSYSGEDGESRRASSHSHRVAAKCSRHSCAVQRRIVKKGELSGDEEEDKSISKASTIVAPRRGGSTKSTESKKSSMGSEMSRRLTAIDDRKKSVIDDRKKSANDDCHQHGHRRIAEHHYSHRRKRRFSDRPHHKSTTSAAAALLKEKQHRRISEAHENAGMYNQQQVVSESMDGDREKEPDVEWSFGSGSISVDQFGRARRSTTRTSRHVRPTVDSAYFLSEAGPSQQQFSVASSIDTGTSRYRPTEFARCGYSVAQEPVATTATTTTTPPVESAATLLMRVKLDAQQQQIQMQQQQQQQQWIMLNQLQQQQRYGMGVMGSQVLQPAQLDVDAISTITAASGGAGIDDFAVSYSPQPSLHSISGGVVLFPQSTSSSLSSANVGGRSGGGVFPRRPAILLECSVHASTKAEDLWLTMVGEMANDEFGDVTANSIMLFSQLLKETCYRLASLLPDASHLVASLSAPSFLHQQQPQFRPSPAPSPLPSPSNLLLQQQQQQCLPEMIGAVFAHLLNVLMSVASDTSFLFVTPQFLRSSNLLHAKKFALYELREHFETFVERRDQCQRAISAAKCSMRLSKINDPSVVGKANGGGGGGGVADVEAVCKALHKTLFQLLLMLEKLCEICAKIQKAANAHEYDLSPAVCCLQRELLTKMATAANDDSLADSTSMVANDGTVGPAGDAVQQQFREAMVLSLANKQYRNAIVALRQLRSQCGNAEFGCCEQMDVDSLLVHFCRNHNALRTWALIGSGKSAMAQSCAQLRDANMQLSAMLRMLATNALAAAANSVASPSRVPSVGANPPVSLMTNSTCGGAVNFGVPPSSMVTGNYMMSSTGMMLSSSSVASYPQQHVLKPPVATSAANPPSTIMSASNFGGSNSAMHNVTASSSSGVVIPPAVMMTADTLGNTFSMPAVGLSAMNYTSTTTGGNGMVGNALSFPTASSVSGVFGVPMGMMMVPPHSQLQQATSSSSSVAQNPPPPASLTASNNVPHQYVAECGGGANALTPSSAVCVNDNAPSSSLSSGDGQLSSSSSESAASSTSGSSAGGEALSSSSLPAVGGNAAVVGNNGALLNQ